MNTYLVTLADRETGKDQRILVQSQSSDDMQEFINSDQVRPTLNLASPVVIAIHQLRVRRPFRTVLTTVQKITG